MCGKSPKCMDHTASRVSKQKEMDVDIPFVSTFFFKWNDIVHI